MPLILLNRSTNIYSVASMEADSTVAVEGGESQSKCKPYPFSGAMLLLMAVIQEDVLTNSQVPQLPYLPRNHHPLQCCLAQQR